jgi:hypothetical protein
MTENLSIADDYDPDGDRPSADSDPVATYLTYLEDKRLGAVGEMEFTLDDFKAYIAGLRKRGSSGHPPGLGSK